MGRGLKFLLLLSIISFVLMVLSLPTIIPIFEKSLSVKIIPEAGEYLPSGSERFGKPEKTKIKLVNVSAEITKLKEGIHYTRITEKDNQVSKETIYIIRPDEPVILLKGSVRNEYEKGFKERYRVHIYAYAYDLAGEEVARSRMGGAPGTPEDYGVLLSIKEGEEGDFGLIIKYNESIAAIKIFASIAEWPAP